MINANYVPILNKETNSLFDNASSSRYAQAIANVDNEGLISEEDEVETINKSSKSLKVNEVHDFIAEGARRNCIEFKFDLLKMFEFFHDNNLLNYKNICAVNCTNFNVLHW